MEGLLKYKKRGHSPPHIVLAYRSLYIPLSPFPEMKNWVGGWVCPLG